jgi:hypothetical protein
MCVKRFALVAVLATLALPGGAHAAFPGKNGKLAFTRGGQVLVMNADGTGQTQITSGPSFKSQPHWSADGHRIAYEDGGTGSDFLRTIDESGGSGTTVANVTPVGLSWSPTGTALTYGTPSGTYPGHVFRVNADGTGSTDLTDDPDNPFIGGDYPSWSPDGFRIAYEGLTSYSDFDGGFFPGSNGIWLMTPAGGFGTQLKGASDHEFYDEAEWSPGATKIGFSGTADPSCFTPSCTNRDLYVMNPDGTGVTKITNGVSNDLDPAWSPDGTKIAFASAVAPPDPATCSASDCNYEIFTVNPDGSGLTRITNNSVPDRWPNWQPIPGPYARPKGASPMRLPLVPAYEPCTSPNRTHGAPLSYGSCAPPDPYFSTAFIGIGDGNPAPAKSIGAVVLKAIVGASGPPDDSDVAYQVSITNVMNTSDRSDYSGELRLELPLRITDKLNNPGQDQGTVTDTSIFATIPCAPTSDSTLGATCSVATTADTLVPNTVREGARSIWALDEVRVQDGGADGVAATAADNEQFAVQGVFVP